MSMTAPHSPEAAACVAAVAVSGHLTDADRNVLRVKAYLAELNGVDPLLIAVEAIVARRVNEALTEAADAIERRCVDRNVGWEIDASERSIYADAKRIVRARIT